MDSNERYFTIKINKNEKIKRYFGCCCCSYIEGVIQFLKDKYPELRYKQFDLYLNDCLLLDSYTLGEAGIKPGVELEIKFLTKDDNEENENQFYIEIKINKFDIMKKKKKKNENINILNIKEKIKEIIGLNVENQELIFDEKILNDDDLLDDLGIRENNEIKLKIII